MSEATQRIRSGLLLIALVALASYSIASRLHRRSVGAHPVPRRSGLPAEAPAPAILEAIEMPMEPSPALFEGVAPDSVEATLEGFQSLNEKHGNDAVRAFATALRIDDSNAEAHRGIAVAYDRMGARDVARDRYAAYLRLTEGRTSADITQMRGIVRARLAN